MAVDTDVPKSNVAAALEAVKDTYVSGPVELENGDRVVFASNDLRRHDLAALNPVLPASVSQREVLVEPASFKDYLTGYKSSRAICKASLSRNQIEAVLDYHGAARQGDRDDVAPARCQHVVTLKCPFDLDYAKWRKAFAQPFDQVSFGNLLEDMVHTISEPPLADILEAIDTLRIDRAVRFKSGVNRRNGTVQFTYEEEEAPAGTDSSGRVSLPESIKIVTPVFQGGELVELDAKLRYRLEKGKVAFLLVVPALDKIERDQFRRIGEDVRTATGTPVFYTE